MNLRLNPSHLLLESGVLLPSAVERGARPSCLPEFLRGRPMYLFEEHVWHSELVIAFDIVVEYFRNRDCRSGPRRHSMTGEDGGCGGRAQGERT